MQDIDFLLEKYRNHRDERNERFSHWIVCAVFALGIIAAGSYQIIQKKQTETELKNLNNHVQIAKMQIAKHSQLQVELASHRTKADLITKLKVPWPRSVILHATLRKIPECITLTRCAVKQSNVSRKKSSRRRRNVASSQQNDKKITLSPAQQDLKVISEKLTIQRTITILEGSTSDTEALHQYLGVLADHRLVISVKLTSIEREKSSNSSRFEAQVNFRPGIGIPGGPVLKEKPLINNTTTAVQPSIAGGIRK